MDQKLTVKKRIAIISDVIRVGKDGKNSFSGYDYFKPDDIFKAINPLLNEYDLITKFDLEYILEKGYYIATLTIEDTDSNDKVVYKLEIAKATVKGANEAQNSGATITYAKRYSFMNAFNLAVNDDDFDSKKPPKSKNNINPELQVAIDDINKLAQALGNSAEMKAKIVKAVKTHHAVANYNGIKDIEVAKKVLEEIKKIKGE